LKEWVRANRDASRPWQSIGILVGDGLPYEPIPPLLRLTIFNNQPTVQISGKAALLPMSGGGRASDPIRFLFLALCAWKLRGGGAVWPTIADIISIRTQLMKGNLTLIFPHIATNQADSGSPVRTWARRINDEADLKRLRNNPQVYRGLERRASESGKYPKPPDRRRTGFMTVSAANDSGADARIAFPSLNAGDIYLYENLHLPIRLS
jgi:hypothetical protein